MKIMNLINKILVCFSAAAAVSLTSCGDGSEDLTPSVKVENMFEVRADDKSADAELRRQFYDNTGIYLLYTDLLGTYTDSSGNEKEERVDFHWGLDTYDINFYSFDLLADDEKQHVTELISKYFIPYINTEHGSLKPYSILLVKNLLTGSRKRVTSYLSCFRCFCINVSDWLEADEEDVKALGRQLLRTLVDSQLNSSTPELAPFFEICEECYDAYYISRVIPEWVDSQDAELIYEKGFLKYYPDSWGEVDYDSFPNEKNDLKSYMDIIFGGTEDDFLEQWNGYPVILRKYEILKECVENIGIDLNAVK